MKMYYSKFMDMNQHYDRDLKKTLLAQIKTFNIHQMCIARVFYTGKICAWNSNSELWSNYIMQKHYKIDPLFKSPDNINPGVYTWSCSNSQTDSRMHEEFRNFFNIKKGITILIKDKLGFISFALGFRSLQAIRKALDNIIVLKNSIFEKATYIRIDNIFKYNDSINLAQLCDESFALSKVREPITFKNNEKRYSDSFMHYRRSEMI